VARKVPRRKSKEDIFMDNNDIVMSRIAFERMQAKDERNDRWRNIIIVLLAVLLALTNAMWLYAWNQYDYYSEEVTVDSDDGGNANYIGEDGNIYNSAEDEE
jgi:hypothetical protein